MSGFVGATTQVIDERRQLEQAWDATSGPWSDARRDEFESAVVIPLVRATADVARDMEATASIVQQALSRL